MRTNPFPKKGGTVANKLNVMICKTLKILFKISDTSNVISIFLISVFWSALFMFYCGRHFWLYFSFYLLFEPFNCWYQIHFPPVSASHQASAADCHSAALCWEKALFIYSKTKDKPHSLHVTTASYGVGLGTSFSAGNFSSIGTGEAGAAKISPTDAIFPQPAWNQQIFHFKPFPWLQSSACGCRAN